MVDWLVGVEYDRALLCHLRGMGIEPCMGDRLKNFLNQIRFENKGAAFVCGLQESQQDLKNIVFDLVGIGAIIFANDGFPEITILHSAMLEPHGEMHADTREFFEEQMQKLREISSELARISGKTIESRVILNSDADHLD